MITPGSNTYDIRDFGAVADGVTLNTAAVQKAIDSCGRGGGGTVFVPPGTYRTGPLTLRDRAVLYLESGAVIAGSTDRADYPQTDERLNAGTGLAPLIGGSNLTGVSIAGRGTIDGMGAPWWKEYLDWRDVNEKQPGDPAREPDAAPLRPRLVSLDRCRDVRIEGITLRNAPAWTLHLLGCEYVRVDGIEVLNPKGHPIGPSVNTDGINPESCRNVWITNCYVAVGDDNITIKAGSEHQSLGPCENITISNCITGHGHGGIVIGSEMSGSVRNVTISNCVFNRTYRGIRIKSRRGRGGTVENVLATSIVMNSVPYPFYFDKYYFDFNTDIRPLRGPGTPSFRKLRFCNIVATDAEKAGHIVGLPEMPIEDVRFDAVSISSRRGFVCKDAKRLTFRDISLDIREGSPMTIERVSSLNLPAGLVPIEGIVNDFSGQYQEREIEEKYWS